MLGEQGGTYEDFCRPEAETGGAEGLGESMETGCSPLHLGEFFNYFVSKCAFWSILHRSPALLDEHTTDEKINFKIFSYPDGPI